MLKKPKKLFRRPPATRQFSWPERKRTLFDELIELGLCTLLGLQCIDDIIQNSQHLMIGGFLILIRDALSNFGLVKAASPLVLYFTLLCSRVIFNKLVILYKERLVKKNEADKSRAAEVTAECSRS